MRKSNQKTKKKRTFDVSRDMPSNASRKCGITRFSVGSNKETESRRKKIMHSSLWNAFVDFYVFAYMDISQAAEWLDVCIAHYSIRFTLHRTRMISSSASMPWIRSIGMKNRSSIHNFTGRPDQLIEIETKQRSHIVNLEKMIQWR